LERERVQKKGVGEDEVEKERRGWLNKRRETGKKRKFCLTCGGKMSSANN